MTAGNGGDYLHRHLLLGGTEPRALGSCSPFKERDGEAETGGENEGEAAPVFQFYVIG